MALYKNVYEIENICEHFWHTFYFLKFLIQTSSSYLKELLLCLVIMIKHEFREHPVIELNVCLLKTNTNFLNINEQIVSCNIIFIY